MSWPNCFRTLACSTARSKPRCAAPSARPAQASRATIAMSASVFGRHVDAMRRRVVERQLGRTAAPRGRASPASSSPAAPLATIARRAGPVNDQDMRRRSARPRRTRSFRTARRRAIRRGRRPRRRRRRRARPRSPPCPGADRRAARARHSMAGWRARGWPPPRRAAAPGTTARPSSSNTSRISRRPVSPASEPSAARPCPAMLAPERSDRLGIAGFSTRGRGRPCAASRSRTDLRSSARSASDTLSAAAGLLALTRGYSLGELEPDCLARPLCAETVMRFKGIGGGAPVLDSSYPVAQSLAAVATNARMTRKAQQENADEPRRSASVCRAAQYSDRR